MKSIAWALAGTVLVNVGQAAVTAPSGGKPAEAWIANFQHYAAQQKPNSVVRQTLVDRSSDAAHLSLEDLLRALPGPDGWAQLRRALVEATAQLPADQKLEKQRLQAGTWLLAYLLGDRAAIEAGLKAAMPAKPDENSPMVYALQNLRQSLTGEEEPKFPPEKQLESFEQQLLTLEPVDEAEVKRALGGEENFARLKRLIDIGREMQARYEQLAKEYEQTKDEAATRTKAEALQKELMEKGKADQEALGEHLNDPLVGRYVMSLYRTQATPHDYVPAMQVPDLVTLAGRPRATALLRRALQADASLQVNRETGDATRQLVRELVLAGIDKLKVPSWGLVQDEHSVELFEAMRKKFPQGNPKDYVYRAACGYYLASLILQDRSADAVKFVTGLVPQEDEENRVNLPYEVMAKLEESHAEELWKFLHAWLAVNPGATEWDRFNRLSVQLDRRDELKTLIKTLSANGGFNGLDRLAVQRMQADAEMATGEIPAATQRLGGLVQAPAATEKERSIQLDIAERLLKLADLQGDEAGYLTGLAAAEAVLAKDRTEKAEEVMSAVHELVATLGSLARYADAARLGRTELDRFAELEKKAAAQKDPDGNVREMATYSMPNLLDEQLRAEVELGHWPEARAVLQERPWWGTKDVAGLLNRTAAGNGKPMGYYAARVALNRGDKALARRILEAQLVATPAVDTVYEAYLGLAGPAAMPLLEKLAASDRYQERPLIWQARLQLEAKKWDAAIATLQQAISIDPSDGEQGRGDRMRVYAFMSLAMAGKGDAEKAGFFANVVKAIRLSETADRWYEIGAYAKAIDLYREALGFFQDAYCIQSRMAIRLADAGKMDEAAEHYRRAFELMPDSFGRVESHCFGCEHVFAGKKSQGVAEEVFARMLQARPDKPQLHYLTGYLREEQERLPEAAEHYRQAVQLDPLYLNAWNRLANLDRKLKFTPAQRDDLAFKLLELDPGHHHVSPDLEKVADLPRLWRVLQATGQVLADLPAPGNLEELKASAARLAEAKDGEMSSWEEGPARKDFATVLLEHNFVRALQAYLSSLNPESEENMTLEN